MAKRKKQKSDEFTTWEDLHRMIAEFKQVIESNIGNEIIDENDADEIRNFSDISSDHMAN